MWREDLKPVSHSCNSWFFSTHKMPSHIYVSLPLDGALCLSGVQTAGGNYLPSATDIVNHVMLWADIFVSRCVTLKCLPQAFFYLLWTSVGEQAVKSMMSQLWVRHGGHFCSKSTKHSISALSSGLFSWNKDIRKCLFCQFTLEPCTFRSPNMFLRVSLLLLLLLL